MTPDGQRFVFMHTGADGSELFAIFNWWEELKAKMGN